MNASAELWLNIAILLLLLNICVIFTLFFNRFRVKQSSKFSVDRKNLLLHAALDKKVAFKGKALAVEYLWTKDSLELDKHKQEGIEKVVDIKRAEKKYLKKIKSVFKTKRIEAAVYLGLLRTDNSRRALERAIIREKDDVVKLYLANALADIGHPESIPILVSTLINSPRFYRDKVNMLIAEFGEAFNAYIPELADQDRVEIKELIVDFSSVYFSETVKQYLIDLTAQRDKDLDKRLIYKACGILGKYYPQEFAQDQYLQSADPEIRNIAVQALANYNSAERMEKLLSFLREEDTARSAVHSISLIMEGNPGYINFVARYFHEEKELEVRKQLAQILAYKIEYFMMKLAGENKKFAAGIIKEIMLSGRNSEVIDFLNKNKDLDLENELIAIIKEVVSESPGIASEFSVYLKERVAQKCGLTRYENTAINKEEKKDKKLIASLYVLLAVSILIFPLLYCLRHQEILLNLSFMEQVKIYVIDFNYYLAFYAMAISLIYLGLLVLSFISVQRQSKLWRIKQKSLLFKKRMLPTVSVIAPAYNEAKTIIESANSLLNLQYPDYELIIVNDGSQDNTLDILIKYFDLTRVDYIFDYQLKTKPVRGIYLNRLLPKLIVVDKDNGGKADSLNTGINISNKEYFCGIDSDSLLEDEALLKLASLTLDEKIETPALGGNVFPINGCFVEQGVLKSIQIPKKPVARFQTIEYIRAFMAGRLGWSLLNSLLIISGAFGLFCKERVIDVGGYLTSSGKYGKDTVGEDMELVVRIRRLMRELGHKYRIRYAFNANCWTEVPEDLKALKKQRYRWQKGLIDILIFHKRLLFNPRYGRTGTVAIPYFFLFEMLGPLIEIQGYLMVVVALVLGLLNLEIALILFVSTVLMGVLISVSSLLIAQKDIKYFKFKDQVLLIIYAIIENFGPRQLFSFWRVGAYFNLLKKPIGWDKAERKGFIAPGTSAKV